jgi:hypothetical protein
MHAHQRPYERAKTDPLALQLIELAVSAGWTPRECIEFAREAHKLVTSTASAVGVHQTVAPAKDSAVDLSQPCKSVPDAAPALHPPKWGPDPGTRRKALQALADKNLTLRQAAEILGVSMSLVGSTAHRLNIKHQVPRSPRPKAATSGEEHQRLR